MWAAEVSYDINKQNVQTELEKVAGRYSDYSGVYVLSGERELGWYFETQDEAEKLAKDLMAVEHVEEARVLPCPKG